MFTENTITIAARCSECAGVIETELSVFSLSGDGVKAACPHCGASALELKLSQDGKVRLSVPCVACPHPHPFTLSAQSMFTKDLFILQCSFTRLDICFMGKKELVHEALEKNGEELRAMMADEDSDGEPDREAVTQNMKLILSFIEECAKNGKLLCRCRDGKVVPGVEVEIGEDSVGLVCKECGRRKTISALDADALDELLDEGVILLDD